MPKLPSKTSKKDSSRQFIDHPDKLLKAILKAVGSLKPGEGLEIRRVRDPKYEKARPAKKKAAKRKTLKG